MQATAEGAALSDLKTHAMRAHCDPVALQGCAGRTGGVLLPARHMPTPGATPGTLADCLAALQEAIEEEEEAYLTDDSGAPDEMTYEARHFRSLHARGHTD